jgi:hypothetical protein
MGSRSPVKLRFSRSGEVTDQHFLVFSRLIELTINRKCILIKENNVEVDIDISSVYGDRGEIHALYTRVARKLKTITPGGVLFGEWAKMYNFQPSNKAKINIFFTGENVRCPYGNWDAYLSFDLDSYKGKNAYFPLWWLTCTELLTDAEAPYLGAKLRIPAMISPREANISRRKKFCVAFVGMPYPFRLQALAALSEIEKVEIYGKFAGKLAKSKIATAKDFRFIFCFENDLYPGYVTEKVFEAWGTGAVPLYWGSDPEGYLNPKAMINLNDFASLSEFIKYVKEVNKNQELWESIASQPLLLKEPNLENVKKTLFTALRSLV